MSGAEAMVVLGVISAIISIVDGTKQAFDAAANTQGLPEAFREVAGRLPIVKNILGSAKQHIDKGDVNEDSCKGVKHIVKACEKKAKKLDELFHKAIPADGASDLERYYKAVKACGKGNEVENLMKGMLEDVQLLACEHGMQTATKAQQDQIVQAITELSAVAPSVPEHEYEETGFTANNYGPGTQNNAQGEYIAQGNARQYNSAGGAMHFASMNSTYNVSVLPPENDKTEACLAALFLTDPRDDREKLMQTKGPIVDGTCKWIKTNALYDLWLRSHSQLLWLSGGPGKGKTMLSIFLAEELERTAKLSQNTLFLQYFCDNKDEKRNTALTIIRGLIFQLLRLRPKLFDHILPSFKIQKESLFTNSSFETLWRIFEIRGLLSTNTIRSSTSHLKLIIVSRDLPEFIPDVLSGFPRIRLDPDADTEVNKDIHRFIDMKVDNLSTYRQYPEPLRVRVKEVFQDRAQGTFLWVGIVAEVLRKYKATEVEKALDLFPSSLEELYARILLQIDVDRRKIAAKILRWVVMAVRPLTLSELSIAIETTVGPTVVAFSRDKVTRDQVSYCGYFLTIKEDQVDLIHQSAKDYLLRRTRDPNPELEAFRVKEEVANIEIARKCFDYLHNSFLPNGEIDLLKNATHLKAFPLLSYAVVHWPEHARSLARSEDIFDLSLPFYNEQSQVRMSWLKTYWALNEYGDPPNSFTPLHLASYFGILPLAENLLLKKGMINKVKRLLYLDKKDGNGQTALNRAARGGHEAVSQLLLLKGADVEARDGEGETALFWAVRGGHETVVRLLLENGADVEAKRNDGWWRALLRAAWVEYDAVGHQALKAYLTVLGIEEWLDVGEPALFWAAWDGHEAIVRLLLEKGADVEARANNRRTALIGAAGGGHEAVVRLLLEKGADVEARANDGRTALIGAAEGGHEAVLRLLLEKGANVEARDNDGWTALIEAAGGGDEVVMQLLLEKGADVEARDNDGWTALFWAARGGHEAVVRLLLEKGADVEARDNDGWTALIRAAWFGHKAIGHEAVKQLLKARLMEKTADVEARDNDGETALMGTTRGAI